MHHWKEKGRKRESYTGVVSSIRSEVVSGDQEVTQTRIGGLIAAQKFL